MLASARTFALRDVASLWVGLVVCVPAWTLVARVVDVGFAAGEAMAVVASANALVLAPMIANGAAGTKYGIGFPVYCRSAFGVRGASVATFARAIVGCGWFGIQTNVGGQALATMTRAMGFAANGTVLPWLGLSVEALVCYLTFLAAQLWVVYHGIESIRRVEECAAPAVDCAVARVVRVGGDGGGRRGADIRRAERVRGRRRASGRVLERAAPRAHRDGRVLVDAFSQYFRLYQVREIATRSNRRASRRFAGVHDDVFIHSAGGDVMHRRHLRWRDQRSDRTGFAHKHRTAHDVSRDGRSVVSDALDEHRRQRRGAGERVGERIPRSMSFRKAGFITAALGTLCMPWKLAAGDGFIFVWLIGYAALLGPITGIMIADYFFVREQTLDIDALYSMDAKSQYWYANGFNVRALASFVVGAGVCVPGFLHAVGANPACSAFFRGLYANAWFVSFFLGGGLYLLLERAARATNKAKM